MAIEKIQVNSTVYNLSSTVFDGQWVISPYMILQGTALSATTTYQYSLTSYLPNDGYSYEVIFSGTCSTTSTKGKTASVFIYPGQKTYSDMETLSGGIRIARAVARTAANQKYGGSAVVPLTGATRYITVNTMDSSANSTVYLWASAYRRLGTNA